MIPGFTTLGPRSTPTRPAELTQAPLPRWQPEFGAALPFEQLIVALVLGAQSERVALHCFALLYKAYRLADYAQEPRCVCLGADCAVRSPTPGP